ncbi:50S ribosomal protein L24 [Candidatus Gottesmanbacteria bacterium CG11_big_fil_rev_8_21_14_0_20_37_11]|uniref:Large ribosomal subunit protein uL24 n=3 Tax=Candidatus Gottesmaniibacteriota TaxID=1752720 RepID=A0A2M7RQQ6_9BACT|nr:MAG: 50S ribosomal protein L24 [Candidatus Gottesmanbacteria bacterium CG1_02_37_22]PIP32622.1 MAG: 50S ribosomal protein L24 [Candidatus Gottesmanbacteria bacterium CG23_combo_of_CG06-09_8_20_14_all_37_19]PIR08498.1 MAG: 50S ribosomal protein L24 [Candidatus Gottesmanbacteria bacterium CG11_big_fil_rev_8_21_14_0_20_37_11]PIZ02638.1 MAG: 50S ribosomal protein L24 [Candidatus Gottesmanbacteria bacterium CG_4_10_14_0_8_um_filter_37_24]
MKLKKGDEVIISIGKDRGKKGKIEKIYPEKNSVLLPNLNVFKRHVKKRDEKNQGGIISFSKPLDVSKVMFVCPKCSKQTRLGYTVKKNEKIRICKKCKTGV